MSKKKLGQCYLCGKTNVEITDDHLPPRNLSPNSPDSVFIKLPACLTCNGKYSHEESKFRDFLAAAGSGWGIASADEALKAARRNFARNPLGNAFRPNKDLMRIVGGLKKRNLYSPNGIFLGTVDTIDPPADLDFKQVLLKIARGLHFHHVKQVVPENYEMNADFMKSQRLPEVWQQTQLTGQVGDFLAYRGGWTREDPQSGVWFMLFYKRIEAIGLFVKPEALKGE